MTTSLTYIESLAVLVLALLTIIAISRYLLEKYGRQFFNPLKSRFPAFCLGFAWTLSLLIASFEITTPKQADDTYEVEPTVDILDLEVINRRTKTEAPKPVKKLPEVIDTIVFIEEDNTDTLTLVEKVVDVDPDALTIDTTVSYTSPPSPPTAPLPLPKDPIEDDTEYKIVEEMPRFPGCESVTMNTQEKEACANQKLLQYVHSMIKYPAIARENNVSGNVIARFVVEKDGSISKINILRDIGAGCGQEVERVLHAMNLMESQWRPGRQQGRPVRVLFTLPVKFSLQ